MGLIHLGWKMEIISQNKQYTRKEQGHFQHFSNTWFNQLNIIPYCLLPVDWLQQSQLVDSSQ